MPIVNKKIGILMDSKYCNIYLYEAVKDIISDDGFEVIFLVNKNKSRKSSKLNKMTDYLSKYGVLKSIRQFVFYLFSRIEYLILSLFWVNFKDHVKKTNIDKIKKHIKIIYIDPQYSKSGFIVKYSKKDIKIVEALDFDLLIRGNSSGILKGEILTSAKKGVISFHHGDNSWNRGGPPAFWEVYLRRPETGFILQILNEDLDGGKVLFRASIPTRRTYIENLVSLYTESFPFLKEVVGSYLEDKNDVQIKGYETTPYSGKIFTTPSVYCLSKYVLKVYFNLSKEFIFRNVFNRQSVWSVSYIDKMWQGCVLSKGTVIKNPKNRFFADPFVIKKDGKVVCFVEDYSYIEKKGKITAIEIIDKDRYKVLGDAIKEEFHMSFPYVFEYMGELYMVPETISAKSIRLYKCTDFPLKWDYQHDLMENVSAVDTMIFKYKNNWWLFTNLSKHHKKDHCSALYIYKSNSPLSQEWEEHNGNPVVFDSRIGRNGGLLVDKNGDFIRSRQGQGFCAYGQKLTLAKITELSQKSFSEEEICSLEPIYSDHVDGVHHIHGCNEYTVFDFVKRKRI
jgi:hypothetical protein